MNYFAVLFLACMTFFNTTNPLLGGICNAAHKPDNKNEFQIQPVFKRSASWRAA